MTKERERMLLLIVALVALFGMGVLFASCSCGGDDDDDWDDHGPEPIDDDSDDCEQQYQDDMADCSQQHPDGMRDMFLCFLNAYEDLIDCLHWVDSLSDKKWKCLISCTDDARTCMSDLCEADDLDCLNNCLAVLMDCYKSCGYTPPSVP